MFLKNNPLFVCLFLTLCACDGLSNFINGGSEEKKLEGTRTEALKSEAVIVADSTLQSIPPEIAPASKNSDWAQHGGTASSFLSHPQLPEKIELRNSASIGKGDDFENKVVSSPVVSGGIVYAMDGAGRISAHDAQDISNILWRIRGVATEDEDTNLTGGLAVFNNVLFAVSSNGLVGAFDAKTGADLWKNDIKIPVRSAPKIAEGKVFITTIDSQIFALSSANGTVLWNLRGINEGSSFLATSSPSIANGLIAVPFSSSELKILQTADGVEIWSDMLGISKRTTASSGFGGFGANPVIVGNALYAVSNSSILGAYRLDNGVRVWEQPVASAQTPFISGNALFLLTSDANVIAFNRIDGRVFWTAKLPRFADTEMRKDPYLWSGPFLAGGKLYVVGGHGEMKVLNPLDGKEIKTLDIPGEVYARPVVANGRMYLVRKNAELLELY